MIGTLDSQVIEKFKEFQKKTGKYSDLDIENVEFEREVLNNLIDIFDSQRVPLSTTERNKRKGKYPYYGASGIIDYIDDFIFDGEYLIISEDGENLRSRKTPIAFWATGQFWVNNHAHIVLGKENILYTDYLRLFISSNKLCGFISNSSQPKLSQGNLQKIPIPLPKDFDEKYKSTVIQKAIVEFLEYSFDNLERIRNNIDKRYEIVSKMRKSLIPSTFKRTAIKNRFRKYAKENNIEFDIIDIEFYSVSFDSFFENVSISKKIKNKEFKQNGIYPVISQSESFINGYYDNNNGIIKASIEPVIIFGDHTTILKYVDFDFLAGADGTKVLKCKASIFPKYAYYQSFYKVKAQGYQRHFQYFKERGFLIPKALDKLSSIEIQEILANFIEHIDNEIDEKYFKKYNRFYEVVELLRETYLKRTFSKIVWS